MSGSNQRWWRAGVSLAMAVVITLCLPAGATAQTEVEDPEGAGSDGEQPLEDPAPEINFDLSEVISVDDDGNLIWNLPTETTDAEDIVVEPTAIPDGAVDGTGSLTNAGSGGTSGSSSTSPGSGSGGESSQNGSGNSLVLVFAIAGLVAVVAAGGVFLVRMRKQKEEDLDVVEDVIDPLANERLAGEFSEPEYAGAGEAGAYEEGGAAYAQHADPDYAAAEQTQEVNTQANKLDQLRASVVDLADRRLADSGHDRLVAKKLEAAGSQMRPGEWLVMAIAGTIGAFAGGTFALGWLLGGFAAAVTAFGFWTYLSFKEGRRQRLFAETLPETLQLIAGSLRGGLSMMQAIQTVADEADAPTAEEFQRIVTETRLGRDLAVSFRDLSIRMASKDFEWVVTAIEIHREVGGDLAGILDRVSDTIRARNRVRGQVKALSAEGKMSGIILFILPPGMVLAISVLNRAYLDEMLDTSEGQIMLVVSGVLLISGGFWLKRLIRFIY